MDSKNEKPYDQTAKTKEELAEEAREYSNSPESDPDAEPGTKENVEA